MIFNSKISGSPFLFFEIIFFSFFERSSKFKEVVALLFDIDFKDLTI